MFLLILAQLELTQDKLHREQERASSLESMNIVQHTYMYVISSAKPHHVCTKIEFNVIIPAYRYTQWLSIPSVSNVKLLFWRAFY